MARFLALDWDHQQLHVVAATVTNGKILIQQAVSWEESQSPNPAEADNLGRRLRERLKEAGIAPAPVLACLGRDRVILKEVRYPAVADHEEAAIVRFQVVKELTDAPDEVVIDYAPVGQAANGERRALVLIARRELLQTYQSLCQAAGLKLAALTPRPFGIAACVRRHTDTSTAFAASPTEAEGAGTPATVAVVTIAQHWAEFSVLRGDKLAFSRAMAVGPNLAGEVRRNLAVYAGQASQHPVRGVYIAGNSEHEDLRQRLQDALALPVRLFDPLAGLERPQLPTAGRAGFTGAVGLLQAQADRTGLPINFVRVKQPGPPRNPNKRRLIVAGAVAAILLFTGVGWCYTTLAALDQQLASLNLQNADYDRQLVPIEEDAKYIKAVGDWTNTDIVWLDELYDVTERFPKDTNLRLISLDALPMSHTVKDKHVASLTLTGVTTDDALAQKLASNLNEDSHYYRVNPLDLSANSSGVLRELRRKFIVRIDIEKRPPTEYHLTLPPPDEQGSSGGRSRQTNPFDMMQGFGGGGGGGRRGR